MTATVCVALAVPLRQFAHERFGVGIDLLAMDTLGVAAVSAVAVGTLAGWLPACRAGRIDIVSALERE